MKYNSVPSMRYLFSLGILMATLMASTLAHAAWQEEWERAVTAAKKEGTVAVMGPTGTHRRDVLTLPFQKKYGINVLYRGERGSGATPLVGTQQRAGFYMWDLLIGGTTTGLTGLGPMGAFQPMDPFLILPEVKNPKNWRGGSLEFVDPGHQMLVMSPSQRGTLFVNRDMVKPGEIKSYKDLLDPKWKGKIVVDDPRTPGPGQATFAFFYMHPDLGPDFIRALARQNILVIKNYRLEIDFVGQGKYPILIGTSDSMAEARMKQGVPLRIVDPRELKEGSDISPAAGNVAVFTQAPHPNATKVYLNWLLSKEGQTKFVRKAGYISNRLDVPTDHSPWRIPIPGSIKTYDQAAMDRKNEIVKFLRKVLRR